MSDINPGRGPCESTNQSIDHPYRPTDSHLAFAPSTNFPSPYHLLPISEMFNERGTVYEFTNLVKELETAGVLYSDKVCCFI